MKDLVIRADAGARMGTGHVMRCLALAQAWKKLNRDVFLVAAHISPLMGLRIVQDGVGVLRIDALVGTAEDAQATIDLARQHGAAWVVIDGYQFGADYQRRLKEAGCRVLFVDDYGHARHYCADLVLNQNLSACEEWYTNRESYTRLLLGTKYVLLRQQFSVYRNWQREIPAVARKVLVTLGGGDPDNVTSKVIEAVGGLEVEVKIVVGGSNPNIEKIKADQRKLRRSELITDAKNMPDLMAWADVAVSAGGTTSWELAFMGLPAVLLVLADNQRGIAEGLDSAGVARNLGWHMDASESTIRRVLGQILLDSAWRETSSQAARRLVDGRGVSEVVRAMECMAS